MTDRRRTFLPVVALGVASAALGALGGSRSWVEGDRAAGGRETAGVTLLSLTSGTGEMPLAAALSLVLLAAWGVLLVTRGVVRRGLAVGAAVTSVLLGVTVIVGAVTLPDQVADAIREAGGAGVGTHLTAWFWATAAASVAALVAAVLAVRWQPAWPEMGSRYDAPGTSSPSERPVGERSNLDLWKSLDEGRDPTA